MEDYHQEYVDKFIELGTKPLEEVGFNISVLEVNARPGANVTRLLLSHKSNLQFFVQFQDNRYDYTAGVMVYKVINGDYDIYSSELPAKDTVYEYRSAKRDADINKLISDFCRLPKVRAVQ